MMKDSTSVSPVKGNSETINTENAQTKPKKGETKKAPSRPKQQATQGTSTAARNLKAFVTGMKTIGLCIKHLVNYKTASQILTNQRLDRRDQTYCTQNRFGTNQISNASALKSFADPKLDVRVLSAQLGKLMEPHTRGVTFNLAAFKQDVETHFPKKVTSNALSTVDIQNLGYIKQQFLIEGRKDKAEALQVIIDAYKEPTTPEGARKFYFENAKEVIAKGKPGNFLRVDGESAPIVGFLKPNGLDQLQSQIVPKIGQLKNDVMVKLLADTFTEPREVLENNEVVTRPLSGINDIGITEPEATLLVMLADKVVDVLAKAEPDKKLNESIKEVTKAIQDRVGTGKGQITQEEANSMIRTVYVNAIILRVASPAVQNLDQKDKIYTALAALVQFIANGQANSDNMTRKIQSPELIKVLETKGDAILRKIENALVKKFDMPEACSWKLSKPETEEDLEIFDVDESVWDEVEFEETGDVIEEKGKGEEPKDDKL